MLRYFRSRAFLISFFTTLTVVLLLIGLLTVDARGRKLSFNDTSSAFEMIYREDETAGLMIHAFSLHREVDVTNAVKAWHFIADFFCIPHAKFPRSAGSG